MFGFAIFAAFFGAGNLILPPYLGLLAGSDWLPVMLGFALSSTVIPLLALLGHARMQGTMMDFGNKVSPLFSLVFCICIYILVIALPCPRTAAVTHEMAIAPFFGSSALATSTVYFTLAFFFAINRGKVLEVLGKYLTPIIGLILLAIIGIGTFASPMPEESVGLSGPVVSGFLEGYQTYDAIAGLLTGGIVVISVNQWKGAWSFAERKAFIAGSGFVAMFGLLLIYAGMISLGARYQGEFDAEISRTELLSGLASKTLGVYGSALLAVLVALACFTTAVSIIVGTSDFFKGLFGGSKKSYVISALVCSLLGVAMGQFNVSYIIDIAIPLLIIIYPICIALILLNVISARLASPPVFRAVVLVTFLFSIPDLVRQVFPGVSLGPVHEAVPLASSGLAWVLPSLITFVWMNRKQFSGSRKRPI